MRLPKLHGRTGRCPAGAGDSKAGAGERCLHRVGCAREQARGAGGPSPVPPRGCVGAGAREPLQ
eukprot:11118946-Lingulodinium_polyedra.AAC.1